MRRTMLAPPALMMLLAALPLLTGCSAVAATLDDGPGNLEGQWQFSTDPFEVGEDEGWQGLAYDDSAWRSLTAPGVWEAQGITDPRPGEQPRPKNGMPFSDYDGVAWYRLTFVVPAAWAGKDLLLHLGNVDDQDRTFLNGERVGAVGGDGTDQPNLVYRDYTIPASAVHFGEVNVLAVRVFDGGGPGGLMGPMLTLLPKDLMTAIPRRPADDAPFAERFANPPASCRILKIIHSWPDDPDSQDSQIHMLLAQGFGGVVCNDSFNDYLESEPRWNAFTRAVNAARDAGMSMWLYDEKGYPSGTAGKLTLQDHPEWEARGLLLAEATTTGDAVELTCPPGTLRSANAYALTPAGIDLERSEDLRSCVVAGVLRWQPPAGSWKVVVISEDFLYENTHASASLGDKNHYINLLMPEPTARFIELTHDQYAKRLGPDLSKWFISTFTDEPSLMSSFWRPAAYRPVPWSPAFAAEFQRRRGYDLTPKLPLLLCDAGGKEAQVRHDFWLTVSQLVAENFFGQIQDRCRQLGFQSGGHLLAEEDMLGHVGYYGDFMRCARRLDAPSIDCLTSIPGEVPWYIARMISSVADLQGRTFTMSEASDFGQTYRPDGDDRPIHQVTEDEIRGALNKQIANGINTITSYYTWTGTTASELRRLNDHVGRACTALRGGVQVADVALLYPIESVWPRYIPGRSGATDAPGAQRINQWYTSARDLLWATGRDFAFVDSQALSDAKVEQGELVHGALRWRVVVLPGGDTLPRAAWENLREFWRTGGVVVAIGSLPTNTDTEFPSDFARSVGLELFGAGDGARVNASPAGGAGIFLPNGAQEMLATALDRILSRDVTPCGGDTPLHATHRRIAGNDVWFVINDSAVPWSGTLKLSAADSPDEARVAGHIECLDPATGEITHVATPSAIPLSLPAYGAMLYRCPSAEAVRPARLAMGAAALPTLVTERLPAVVPTVGKGEFVDGGVTEVGGTGGDFRAVGRLTKSDTDTFLFVSHSYPDGVDLASKQGLILHTTVPEGQQTSSQLLVMISDRAGGLHIASTGRSLASSGSQTTYVPIRSFTPAGWAPQPATRFDLSDITGITVGWGGYFGKEGETVEFTLQPLEVATFE